MSKEIMNQETLMIESVDGQGREVQEPFSFRDWMVRWVLANSWWSDTNERLYAAMELRGQFTKLKPPTKGGPASVTVADANHKMVLDSLKNPPRHMTQSGPGPVAWPASTWQQIGSYMSAWTDAKAPQVAAKEEGSE